MESVAKFMWVLASSSLWLAGSGLVLWLCLRSRLRLSPGTRAVASLLIVLQGWIWIGIPVELDLSWLRPKAASLLSHKAAAVDAVSAFALVPSDSGRHSDSQLLSGAGQLSTSEPVADSGPVSGSAPVSAARLMPDFMPAAGAVVSAVWMVGIVALLWRSIYGFVVLSRMVHMLPRAPVEWQNELSALCWRQPIGCKQAMDCPLVLKVGNVASPMLVQTWSKACIVVPAWLWESCTAEQRTSILLHELEHFRRGDVWRQLAMRLLVLPHWFNPVAWWAARQFEAASEAICDEAACGDDPRVAISYSKALLVLNETILNERLGFRYVQALAISGGSLTERIRRVLHPEFQEESQMSRFVMLSAMVVLAGLATIRIQAADESATAKTEVAENEAAQEPGVTLRRRTITEEYEKAEPAKATAGSLLPNGGFEEVRENSNDPQEWFGTRYPPTAGHHVLSSSSVAHSGKRSVVVEIGDSHPDTRVDYNWTAEAKGWKAGETYELSGWIKTENAKGPGFIMAQCWSEDGKRALGYSESPCEVRGTTDWTRVRTLLKVPEGTGVVRIRAGLTSQNNKGAKAWLDDISLVPTSRSANESNRNESAKKATPAPGSSLLANGGFEEVQESTNDPQEWFGTRLQKTAGHFVLASSSVAHGGKRSAVVEIGDSHPDQKVAYNWTAVANGWKAGETYELSGWVKTENVNKTAFIMAQFWDEEPKMIGGATTQFTYPVTGTTDWTRVRTRVKVPEGTRVLRIRAGLSSQDNRGAKAWLDDISLVKVASN